VIINGPASTGKTIDVATPTARNLIAGNGEQGVEISASDASTVRSNLIGTKTGTTDLGNVQDDQLLQERRHGQRRRPQRRCRPQR
jgi:hypothetical protein